MFRLKPCRAMLKLRMEMVKYLRLGPKMTVALLWNLCILFFCTFLLFHYILIRQYYRIKNGSIYPCNGWNSDVTYVAHFRESYPENSKLSVLFFFMTLDKMKVFCKRFIIMFLDLNDNKIDYIERLKKFMFYSILTKTESGSFENVSAIRSCVTVATKEYALMAAHCLPVDIPEQFKFAIYNQDDKPHIVQIVY